MRYFEIILQIIAILVGGLEIYNKKVNNKDYQEGSFIILALAIFYSKNSEDIIVGWLVFVVSIIILFIIVDKIIIKIKKNN